MEYDILIKGGKVVIPRAGVQDVDIAINKNKVAALYARGSGAQARAIIDASNKYVLPGVIDPHVHWGHAGAIAPEIPAESRAAAIGGCTTIIQFSSAGGFFDKKLAVMVPSGSSKKEAKG